VIQGQGGGTIINCSGDWNAFDITNATSCIIKDLKIDSSNIGFSLGIININEINDNPVYIEKVQIVGNLTQYIYGINISSGNVWISDCYISEVYQGIYQTSSVGIAHICNNRIFDCEMNGITLFGDNNYISGNNLEELEDGHGIGIFSSFNIVTDNSIRNSQLGIYIFGDNNTIKDNNIYSFQSDGIISKNSDYNEISGNSILDGIWGISLDNCDYCVILGNLISNVESKGIILHNCTSNLISGNQISFGNDHGIYLNDNCDYNVISGNSIFNISRNDFTDFAGIQLSIDADFNAISGNGIFNCINYGGGKGYGIRIWEFLGFFCNNNTVLGNTALNNEINWDDGGTDTFGDSTNNNFG